MENYKKKMTSIPCQIYRSVELRSKILMRADSIAADFNSIPYQRLDEDNDERLFRVRFY